MGKVHSSPFFIHPFAGKASVLGLYHAWGILPIERWTARPMCGPPLELDSVVSGLRSEVRSYYLFYYLFAVDSYHHSSMAAYCF
jgi:hypothetical protein